MRNLKLILRFCGPALIAITAMFLIERFLFSNNLIQAQYGVNPKIFIELFLISEVMFNVGLILMLWGSGLLSWKNYKLFKWENISWAGKRVYLGFLTNRMAAIIPWGYVLFSGRNKLPWYIILVILIEVFIVLFIGWLYGMRKKKKLEIRQASPSDLEGIIDVERLSWPNGLEATRDMFASRMAVFPEGVLVAEWNGQKRIIGVIAFELLNYDLDSPYPSWGEITDGGFIVKTHNAFGEYIYGVDLSVDPDFRENGVARRLLQGVGRIAVKRNLRGAILGGRLPGFYQHSKQHSVSEYINLKRKDGYPLDPELRFYVRAGLKIMGFATNYFKDPESENFGVILLWKNPFFLKNRSVGKLAGQLLYRFFKV